TCLVLALPGRRLHNGRPDAKLLHRGSEAALVPCNRILQRQGAGPEPAAVTGRAPVRTWELHAASRDDVLGDAGHGVPRQPRLPRARSRGILLPPRHARTEALAPVGGRFPDPAPIPRSTRRLGADRGRAPALDRLR